MVLKNQHQILRSWQKDTEAIENISQTCLHVLTKLRFGRLTFKDSENLNEYSKLLYFLLTSLSNLQTLGEEYTGLIRVDKTFKVLPNKFTQVTWLLLETYGEPLRIRLFNALENNVRNNEDLIPAAKDKILKFLSLVKCTTPLLGKLQKANFYLYGQYYDIPTKLAGINYKPIRPAAVLNSPSYMFKLLGVLSVIDIVLSFYSAINKWETMTDSAGLLVDNKLELSGVRCVLCLDNRLDNSITQCGHIFCWKCIADWSNIRQECPVCREIVRPSRTILLQNY